jgi:hypothetical protein
LELHDSHIVTSSPRKTANDTQIDFLFSFPVRHVCSAFSTGNFFLFATRIPTKTRPRCH